MHIPESPVSPFHLFLGTLITLVHSVVVIVQEFDILPQCLEERGAKLALLDVTRGL